MTSPQQPAPAPWWQTLLVSSIHLVLVAAVQHYLGNAAAAAAVGAGTSIAHAMTSPKDQ
jgi:N-methylhydantoinase B/oxoprolinase/acetone carboxylase alpha subunit